MITSPHNPKIKWVRALQTSSAVRREESAFVVEGVRLVEEALSSGWKVLFVLFTEGLSSRGQALLEALAEHGATVEQVTPQVMRLASDTQTPQGILAVLGWRALPLPSNLSFVLIPDVVRDPGNLGTMLRTAAAAGVEAVLVPPGTVDPLAPKVVRAGMGAHFRLPIQTLDWDEIHPLIKPLSVYLAAARQGIPYTQADFCAPMALIIGGEAEGVEPVAQGLATHQVHIPMPGGSESLNAAIAAAILLFEAVRQRSGFLLDRQP